MNQQTLAYLGVFAVAAAYWLPLVPLGLSLYDEGLSLYGAERILAGERPYYDFFAYYGPGHFYWPALLFALFGTEIIVARLGNLLFGALAAVALFALGRNAGLGPAWSLLPVAAALLPLAPGKPLPLCDPALALLLVGGAVLTSCGPARSRSFAAGLLFGVVAVFRHDFGVYAVLAGALSGLWILPAEPTRGQASWERLIQGVWRLRHLALGVGAVIVPVYGLLALGDPHHMLEALVYPADAMPYRTLPYLHEPRQLYWAMRAALVRGFWADLLLYAVRAVVFATPLVAVMLGLSLTVPEVRTRILTARHRSGTLLFLFLGALGLSGYALGRSDVYHVFPLYVLSACAIAIMVGALLDRPAWDRVVRMIGTAVAALAGLVLACVLALEISHAADYVPLGLPRAAGVLVPKRVTWVTDAVADVEAYARGPRILVASPRHDRVHWNAVMLYFLSGRASGTYFYDFIPGLTTSRETQERIVRDLRTNDVRTVVVWRSPLPDEPNWSAVSSRVTVLDDFLRSEFAVVRERPDYAVIVKSH
jgi:hypothetical protein